MRNALGTAEFWRKAGPFLVIGFALFVFVAPLFFGRTLTNFSDLYAMWPGTEHQPAGWFHSDAIDASPSYFFNPSDLLNRQLLHRGEAFSWNPYVGFGTPWLGGMQGAPYFPGKLISMLWPDYWRGQDMMFVALLLVAGVGNYLLLRSMSVTCEGAVFGGLAYMLCQRLFLIINMPSFQIECLLPILLFAIHQTVRTKRLAYAAFAGFIAGAQFLGGFPEASFVVSVIAGLFFVWLLIAFDRSTRARLSSLKLALVIGVIALALSGFQLAEFVRFVAVSHNSHNTTYGTVVKEPFWLLPLFLPNFFGQPLYANWFAGISPFDHMPASLFCGISTVLLAFAGAFWWQAPNRRYFWFFAAVLLLFLGYDYGFPVLKYLGYLPLFNRMSTAWNAFVIPFGLSVLAGFGVQSLRQRGVWLRLGAAGLVYAVAVALLVHALPGPRPLAMWASFIPLLWVLPLFVGAIVLTRDVRWMQRGAVLLFALITVESLLCVRSFGYLHYYGPKPEEYRSLKWLAANAGHDRVFGIEGMYAANTLNPLHVHDIRHLDAMYPDLYVQYVDAIWPGSTGNVWQIGNPEWKTARDPLLDLAAVKYVLSKKPLDPVPAGLAQVYSDPEATIYRSDKAVPRAYFVGTALKEPKDFSPASLKGLADRLQNAVVLQDYAGAAEPGGCKEPSGGPVDFTSDDAARVQLSVDAPCDGFVVLADLFYPGWRAAVDGHDAAMYRANFAFRAVPVPRGRHIITFAYRPWSVAIGLPLAGVTVLLLLGGLGVAIYRAAGARPRKPSLAPSGGLAG